MKIPCFLLLLLRVRSQEVSTPSSLLWPRNYNHHPFDAQQYLKSLKAEPTKQGPVLFPNDAPPAPRPPLVVTARPLLESIARSELGAPNNTEPSQSQLSRRVSFLPYLARDNAYRPFAPSPNFDYNFAPAQIPYAEVVKKSRLASGERDNRYNDYEEQTILPPIYKALSDHAEQKVLKLNEKQKNYIYQTPQPDFSRNYQNNDINEENSDYDQNNYAFSYRVNDHKTGDDFSHSQQSSGSATNGEYRVRLPDGRMQIVSYTADENGYKADVRYDDENTISNKDSTNINNPIYNNVYTDYDNVYERKVDNKNTNGVYTVKNVDYTDKSQVDYVGNGKLDYAGKSQVDYAGNGQVDYAGKSQVDYVGNGQVDYAGKSQVDYVRNGQIDYVDKKDTKDDYYHYPETNSKEYYNDYSSEYNSNYEPHKTKFSSFTEGTNSVVSTVKPSYEELKDLLVKTSIYNTKQNYDPIGLNVASTSPFESTTERVVLIGNKTPNLYTNIKSNLPNYSPRVILATTPRNYLVSTIANLKNKVHLATPVLSDKFIDKINKYLSFN